MSQNEFLGMDFHGFAAMRSAFLQVGTERNFKAALQRSLVKASSGVVAHARQLAPKDTDRMADKIAVTTRLSRRQRRLSGTSYRSNPTVARAYIGAGPKGPAVLAEFGTGPRYTEDGAYRGMLPAQPFMRPAWEAGKQQVLQRFIQLSAIEVDKSAKRAGKRAQSRRLSWAWLPKGWT